MNFLTGLWAKKVWGRCPKWFSKWFEDGFGSTAHSGRDESDIRRDRGDMGFAETNVKKGGGRR